MFQSKLTIVKENTDLQKHDVIMICWYIGGACLEYVKTDLHSCQNLLVVLYQLFAHLQSDVTKLKLKLYSTHPVKSFLFTTVGVLCFCGFQTFYKILTEVCSQMQGKLPGVMWY